MLQADTFKVARKSPESSYLPLLQRIWMLLLADPKKLAIKSASASDLASKRKLESNPGTSTNLFSANDLCYFFGRFPFEKAPTCVRAQPRWVPGG